MEITIYVLNNNQILGYLGQTKILKNKKGIAVGFNIDELKKYPHLYNSTVIHEFCHIWAWGEKRNINHGKYWKSLMIKAGERPYISI